MTEGNLPPPRDDFDARLRALKERTGAKGEAEGGKGDDGSGLGTGLKVAVDLLAGVVVGVGIGYLVDRWLGTAPWFLVAMLFVGFAAGLLNVYRTAQELERRAAAGKGETKKR